MPTNIEAQKTEGSTTQGLKLGSHPVDALYPPLDQRSHNLIVDFRGRPGLITLPQRTIRGLLGPTHSEQRMANMFGGQKFKKPNRVFKYAAGLTGIGLAGLGAAAGLIFDTHNTSAQGLTTGNNYCPPSVKPGYVPGSGNAALFEALGEKMGTPLTCEYPDPNGSGDVHQKTEAGLAFWRKKTNTPTFTNGFGHWAITPNEPLAYWTGSSIDPPGFGGLPQGGGVFPEAQPGALPEVDLSADTTLSSELSCLPPSTNWLSKMEMPTYSGNESVTIDGFKIDAPLEYQSKIAEALSWVAKSPEDYNRMLTYLKGILAAKHKNPPPPTPGWQQELYELHVQNRDGFVVGTSAPHILALTYGTDKAPIGTQKLAVQLVLNSNAVKSAEKRVLQPGKCTFTAEELKPSGIKNYEATIEFAKKVGLHFSIIQSLENVLDTYQMRQPTIP